MLWQTVPNPCDNHRHALRKYQRGRERGGQRWRDCTKKKKKKQEQNGTVRRQFLWMLAAAFWWAIAATCLRPSSSWFLILLAEMPLQSPSPPAHTTQQAAACLHTAPTRFLLCSHGLACMHCSRGCIRVNGPDSCRSHFGHISVCWGRDKSPKKKKQKGGGLL